MNRNTIIGKLQWVLQEINEYLKADANKGNDTGVLFPSKVYKLDIRERDQLIPIINEGKVIATKKAFYGTVVIYYIENEKTYLIWREVYQFINATERRRDFLWKERLCDKILYEAVGVFLTMAQDQDSKEYNVEIDNYVITPKVTEKEIEEGLELKGE